MDIKIQKGTSVSLHSQLVTQISMQITAGLLKPGSKLPSIRALSQKLDIHHNTCLTAYREIAANGLIELQHGSGARVKDFDMAQPASLPADTTLEVLADFFIRQTQKHGYSWQEVESAIQKAKESLNGKTAANLVFVDLHADILPVFKTELEALLNLPVEACSLENLVVKPDQTYSFIVSRYHVQALKDKLKTLPAEIPETNYQITVIDLGSGKQELEMIHKLPEGSLIAIVSASTIILRQAEAVVRAIRGEELLIRTILYGQEPIEEIHRLAKRVKLIFADQVTMPHIKNLPSSLVQPIRAIPEHETEKLKALLPQIHGV